MNGTRPVLTWDPAINYKFRLEWGPPSGGYTPCKFLRNDVTIWQRTLLGTYTPPGHGLRLGWSLRDADDAPINAIYSNLTVYELSGNTPPSAPTVTDAVLRGNGQHADAQDLLDRRLAHRAIRCTSTRTTIQPRAWSGTPARSIPPLNEATAGTLSNNSTYYVFVRLANSQRVGLVEFQRGNGSTWTPLFPTRATDSCGSTATLWKMMADPSWAWVRAISRPCGYARMTRQPIGAIWPCSRKGASPTSGFFPRLPAAAAAGGMDGRQPVPLLSATADARSNAWPDYDQVFRDLCRHCL